MHSHHSVPAIILLAGIKLLPDSPRYLVGAGRDREALEVLEHLRGGASEQVALEMAEMCAPTFELIQTLLTPLFELTGSNRAREPLSHRPARSSKYSPDERATTCTDTSEGERGFVYGCRSCQAGRESPR